MLSFFLCWKHDLCLLVRRWKRGSGGCTVLSLAIEDANTYCDYFGYFLICSFRLRWRTSRLTTRRTVSIEITFFSSFIYDFFFLMYSFSFLAYSNLTRVQCKCPYTRANETAFYSSQIPNSMYPLSVHYRASHQRCSGEWGDAPRPRSQT